jgi:mRNA-degrading endonuclease RelE of RelBE toxin-antitoxin system
MKWKRGLRRIEAGLYVDGKGALHIDAAEFLAAKGYEKVLADLTGKDPATAARIAAKLKELLASFFPAGAKKLKGHTDDYRLRVGPWRILYTVDKREKQIFVTDIEKRGQAGIIRLKAPYRRKISQSKATTPTAAAPMMTPDRSDPPVRSDAQAPGELETAVSSGAAAPSTSERGTSGEMPSQPATVAAYVPGLLESAAGA